ncbi:uncharacterized protein LOC117112667 [Anneissia japonica]|uniref:uncharacterized protein LOC117112667 n=1 Tax=Anneissia japonica TaxID=1529436 RepID=UPI0014255B4A|nr:uncharacterized protein LOC117112667 [Anneissia japonica]XP_033111672.1 uncharacterized protein LOC117112667 [Anneissia japonica]
MEGMQFNVLKMVVSKWYDDNRSLTMLKVLFRDHVAIGKLATINDTMDLLNDLFKSSQLTPSDLTILGETINLTKHYALQERIKSTFQLFPDVREGTVSIKFTPHRQRLMKFGMALTPKDVTLIDGLYNTPLKRYADAWIMINDLEDQLKIKEGDMKEFQQMLETLNLRLALNALKEDISGTSSAFGIPSTSSVLVPSPTPTLQVPEAYQMPKMDRLQFNQLLGDVSTWWKRYGNVNMLKVILSEFKVISVVLMEEKSEPRSLFELLKGSGLISEADVDVIIETVILGGQSGVELKIKESIPTFPGLNTVEITKFSNHRQNLLEFGKVIDGSNKERIGYLFGLYVPELKDQWSLIFQLEKGLILTEDSHVKQAFVKKLNDNGMVAEAKALNTFP